MTLGVSQVSIYVDDQDEALDFWSKKVGCTVTTDAAYAEGTRWIEVTPPDGGTRLVIYKADEDFPDNTKGMLGYVLFQADDINKTYQELSARGVEFTQAPEEQPWGWTAVFKDPDGHLFHLGQR